MPVAPDDDHPGDLIAQFPEVVQPVPQPAHDDREVDKLVLIESVKRVAPVAECNTAVQLAFSDGVLTLDAGSGEEAEAVRVD